MLYLKALSIGVKMALVSKKIPTLLKSAALGIEIGQLTGRHGYNPSPPFPLRAENSSQNLISFPL
jgi:hypothetical protein